MDGLDQVDWARLSHAYGPADDVPAQLRDLVSPDERIRLEALSDLNGNILHQGTIYEATAAAVPFLLQALTAPECDEQPQLLDLLCHIAVGHDEGWLPAGFPVARYRAEAIGGDALLAAAPHPGDDDYDEDEADLAYVEDLDEEDQNRLHAHIWVRAYDAVRAGVPLFRELLTWEPPVACMAAYTLAWFPEDAAESLPALAEVTGGDEEGVVAATASVAMGLLGGHPAVGLDDPRPIARWGAAIALASVADLIAATALPANHKVPFLSGDLASYAVRVLRQAGERDADRTFDTILAGIPTVSGYSALHVVGEALRMAFPDGPGERQRRLLDVLAGSPGTWLIEGRNFASFMNLMDRHGLPTSPAALRDYTSTR
ncbi:hypothetical protein [Lentzea sp. NBRC 102530]|uniref:hypothetical protein n=1 Tax=Lentzea sp. NBRC 102530 TaxID=3032201 RepID=UPI00249FC703|nr:hypothetical protein [Lentzea sp. NBRC 102530]GLY50872.1 hypothetical protein Lesp01_45280 [Lentzea sp. NBRC 102530]